MDKSAVLTLIAGLVLLTFMLIINNHDQNIDANFNDYQAKIYESRVEQFQANGMSPYQSNIIAGAIRDESSMVKNMITSNSLMQSYMTTMTGLVMICVLLCAVNKSKKE